MSEYKILIPYAVFCSPRGGHSAFNFVPWSFLNARLDLMKVAAIPFFALGAAQRPVGSLPPPIIPQFVADDEAFSAIMDCASQPVLVFGESIQAIEIARVLFERGPLCLCLVTDNDAIGREFERAYAAHPEVWWVPRTLAASEPGLPVRIWSSLVNFLAREKSSLNWLADPLTSKGSPPEEPSRSTPGPGRFNGSLSRVPQYPVGSDLLTLPSQVVYSLLLGQIPDPPGVEPALPDGGSRHLAEEIIAIKVLLLFVQTLMGAHVPAEDLRKHLPDVIPESFWERLLSIRQTACERKDIEGGLASLIADLPTRAFLSKLRSDVLLVLPASSARKSQWKERVEFVGPGAGSFERDKEYAARVLHAAAKGGRRLQLPPPKNEDQQIICQSVQSELCSESEYLAAFTTLIATRYQIPVLRALRYGDDVYRLMEEAAIDFAPLEEGEDAEPAFLHRRLAIRIDDVGFVASKRLRAVELPLIESLARTVHVVGDFPAELLHGESDYLGYITPISRTPLSRAEVALASYYRTASPAPMPNDLSDITFCSCYSQFDPHWGEMIQNWKDVFPGIQDRVVTSRFAFLDEVEAASTKMLIYYGHGSYDPSSDTSSIVLKNAQITQQDIESLERVPPIVVLVGCNTASATSVAGGIHRAFIAKGARLVVGTTYPMDRFIGLIFLHHLLRNLLASPSENDSFDCVMHRARVATRPSSVLYSCFQQGRLDHAGMRHALQAYGEAVGDRPLAPAETLPHLAAILAERGLIERADVPPLYWGDVPYPLFFSLTGLPWTTKCGASFS